MRAFWGTACCSARKPLREPRMLLFFCFHGSLSRVSQGWFLLGCLTDGTAHLFVMHVDRRHAAVALRVCVCYLSCVRPEKPAFLCFVVWIGKVDLLRQQRAVCGMIPKGLRPVLLSFSACKICVCASVTPSPTFLSSETACVPVCRLIGPLTSPISLDSPFLMSSPQHVRGCPYRRQRSRRCPRRRWR